MPDPNENILSQLEPEFASKIKTILGNCKNSGVEIMLRDGNRNAFTQAVYWRRSREDEEVEKKIQQLQDLNANFIAYCLFVVGKQAGKHNTNALPGLSWHQYGLAVDCAWVVDSKICWDNETRYNGINGYELLAIEAKKLGVYSGHDWEEFRDSGHLQATSAASPLETYSWETIDQVMYEKYAPLLESRM